MRVFSVSAVVLVINSTDVRFSKSLQEVFRTFQEAFCGDSDHGHEDFYDNLLICFQRWKMDPDSVADRADEDITEESITDDINKQFQQKFKIGRAKNFPCVFLNSHERDEVLKRERLLKVKDLIPEDVFRTADLAQIVPRLHSYDSMEQIVVQGTAVIPMKPQLIDPRVEVTAWEIEPPLPTGLQFCPQRGHITGTPLQFGRACDHKLVASSHGGRSEPFLLANFEVRMSEQEMVGRIGQRTKVYEAKIEVAAQAAGSDPSSEAELAELIASIDVVAAEYLAEASAELCAGELTGLSQLPELVKRLEVEAAAIKSRLETDLQMKHKDHVSQEATRRLELEKADNAVQRKLLSCTEDYEDLQTSIEALEGLSVDESSSEAETLQKSRAWLGQIATCRCSNDGCPQMLMRKDQALHDKSCLFGLPLLPHSAIRTTQGENFDEKVELNSTSGDDSWVGVYECGECPYPVSDNDSAFFYLVNQGQRRVQRIKKQDGGRWVITAWEGPDEEEKVHFTSTNEAESFADVTFEEFVKSPPRNFSWVDPEDVEEKVVLLEESVKLVYFTGMWCPYCPPFTAKLKKFFEIITEQFGSRALQVISISGDQSEEEMLEYYGGTFTAIPTGVSELSCSCMSSIDQWAHEHRASRQVVHNQVQIFSCPKGGGRVSTQWHPTFAGRRQRVRHSPLHATCTSF